MVNQEVLSFYDYPVKLLDSFNSLYFVLRRNFWFLGHRVKIQRIKKVDKKTLQYYCSYNKCFVHCVMTAHETMAEITKEKKWYLGKYKQQTASAIVKRFYAGTLGFATLTQFFNNFGYTLTPGSWDKK